MLILVTGGTGALGTVTVPRLVEDGHTVRVLTRRPRTERDVRGDLETGEGLEAAVTGVDAIVHLASAPHKWNTPRVDVHGTRRLLGEAAQAGVGHLVYVSIVGVGTVPSRYFRFKRQAEELVAEGQVPWSILRATPFPEFTEGMLRTFSRLGPVVVPARTPWQIVDAGEVADGLVSMVGHGPSYAVDELGGPEVRPFDEYARAWLRARGSRRPIMPVWLMGRTGRTQRQGHLTTQEGANGRKSWQDYLDACYGTSGAKGVSEKNPS